MPGREENNPSRIRIPEGTTNHSSNEQSRRSFLRSSDFNSDGHHHLPPLQEQIIAAAAAAAREEYLERIIAAGAGAGILAGTESRIISGSAAARIASIQYEAARRDLLAEQDEQEEQDRRRLLLRQQMIRSNSNIAASLPTDLMSSSYHSNPNAYAGDCHIQNQTSAIDSIRTTHNSSAPSHTAGFYYYQPQIAWGHHDIGHAPPPPTALVPFAFVPFMLQQQEQEQEQQFYLDPRAPPPPCHQQAPRVSSTFQPTARQPISSSLRDTSSIRDDICNNAATLSNGSSAHPISIGTSSQHSSQHSSNTSSTTSNSFPAKSSSMIPCTTPKTKNPSPSSPSRSEAEKNSPDKNKDSREKKNNTTNNNPSKIDLHASSMRSPNRPPILVNASPLQKAGNYFSTTQLLRDDIDCGDGLIFQDLDFIPSDQFLHVPGVRTRWHKTKSKTVQKKNGKKAKLSMPISQEPNRLLYGGRMTISGVSINLGSDHLTSLPAAAALDIASKLYQGADNNRPYYVLSEVEVMKALDAVGYGSLVDSHEFKHSLFTQERKEQFESLVDRGLSSLGGRDDLYADILCGLDKNANKKSALEKSESVEIFKGSKRKRKAVSASKNGDGDPKYFGEHVIFDVDDGGTFSLRLDDCISSNVVGNGKSNPSDK